MHSNSIQACRSFLLLQGPCSPFFTRLADRLAAEGHFVSKINFNGGDSAYWGMRPAWSFRWRLEKLEPFLEEKYRSAGVTDIVLFGDRRPVHRPAIELAKKHGIRVHVFEEGYFRPYWVTLEREGVNALSLLPRDPDWYRRTGRLLADMPQYEAFRTLFRVRAMHAVLYRLGCVINPVLFPGYRNHASFLAPVMFAGYVKRFALRPRHQKKDSAAIKALIASRAPYYLLPLQLNSDAQIRDHSSFAHMSDVLEFAMESFARHAPPNSSLVIKNHPLDMGLVNYPRIIRKLAKRFDIPGKVVYLETGNLELLVQYARGSVTVNSTVGSVALQYNCPTIALGNSIYNIPGLTFQGPLDQFWQATPSPDEELFHCFKSTVIRTSQINGSFYCTKGIQLAVENSLANLTAERSPLEALL